MSTAARASEWNCVNYLGPLFSVAREETPLIDMIGGLSGNVQIYDSVQFPMAQPWSTDAAGQPTTTENQSIAGLTKSTYTRAQDTNYHQIFQENYGASYLKQSITGKISGVAIAGGEQPVMNEVEFQRMACLKQIALNYEYCCTKGASNVATTADTYWAMNGLENGISTNAVAAGSVALSKDLINELVRTMLTNGAAISQNFVIWVNAFQAQQLSSIFGYAPMDRTVGGVAVQTILLDIIGYVGVKYSHLVSTDTLMIVNMGVVQPTGMVVPQTDANGLKIGEKGVLFWERIAQAGASNDEQIYGQLSINYGPEEYHGKITGLTTS